MKSLPQPSRPIIAPAFQLLVVLGSIGLSLPLCQAQLLYTGVNLSGAEFGQTSLPGTFGTNYTYPTHAEINYFTAKGVNTFRLPFRWERLQHSPNAALDATELGTASSGRMTDFVTYATGKGEYVILDPHNFERYYPLTSNFESSANGLVGGTVANTQGVIVTVAMYSDFWSRVANQFKNNSHVIFNLMNEPNTMPTEQLVTSENAAIAAIRAAGAHNLVLVPGNAWTGAWTWGQNWYGTPNASAMLGIVDPGNNYAFDMHQYFDSDGSGTHDTIDNDNPTTAVMRLTAATQWLQANHLRGFLGEFAVANASIGSGTYTSASDGTSHPQIGDETLNNVLTYLKQNENAWLGWTWWGGGPWWAGGPGNPSSSPYMFLLDPANLGTVNQTDKPAIGVLQPYFATVPEPSALLLAALGFLILVAVRHRPLCCFHPMPLIDPEPCSANS